nr:venom gland protein U10-PHTX-Pmx1a [Physocyclus mexicanus]
MKLILFIAIGLLSGILAYAEEIYHIPYDEINDVEHYDQDEERKDCVKEREVCDIGYGRDLRKCCPFTNDGNCKPLSCKSFLFSTRYGFCSKS